MSNETTTTYQSSRPQGPPSQNITDFVNPEPISGIYHNVERLVIRRDYSDFQHFCTIFVLGKSNPNYHRVIKLLAQLLTEERQDKQGLVFDLSNKLDLSSLKKKSYYFLDLRAEPDLSVNPITLKNRDKVIENTIELTANDILNNTRGLIVFADSYTQVPNILYARSQWGLTQENGVELHQFIHKGSSKTTRSCPVKNDNDKLYGYITSENWAKIIEY
jgi:hypothetical protein